MTGGDLIVTGDIVARKWTLEKGWVPKYNLTETQS